MPLTIFDTKGIPGNRRERIEAAVMAHLTLSATGQAEYRETVRKNVTESH
jgi:hypothetical protein